MRNPGLWESRNSHHPLLLDLFRRPLKAALGMVGAGSVRVSERIAFGVRSACIRRIRIRAISSQNVFDESRRTGVKAALRARSGELAFKFWDTLMRGRVDDDSPEHVKLRRHIAARVRKDCERGGARTVLSVTSTSMTLGGGDHKSVEVREHEQASTLLQEPGR